MLHRGEIFYIMDFIENCKKLKKSLIFKDFEKIRSKNKRFWSYFEVLI